MVEKESSNNKQTSNAEKTKEDSLLLSEQQLKMVLEGSDLGFWDWNIETNEVQRNDHWAQMLGYSAINEFDDTVDTWINSIYPDDRDIAWKSINDHLEGRTTSHKLEYRMLTKDGGYKWILDNAKIVQRDSNGHPLRMCGTHMDITERKKMEDEIHSSEQHLKLYREQAPMATIEWNTDFQVMDWNKAAEKMFGYTVDEVRGRNFVDIMLPDSVVVDVKQIWKDLMAQTGGELSINENLTKDGRIILCEWHNTTLKNESGKVIGAASIVQDITERKQQDEQLRRSMKMDALGKLTGGIAHDYNNMLGVILGYSELLKEMYSEQEQPKLHKYIQHINRSAERGANLTKKLLSFTSHKSSNEESVNINSLLEYEKDMLEKTLTARIKLVYQFTDGLWPVWLDSSELEDVIINLSINAMHAIDGNGHFTIHTDNVSINEAYAQLLQIKSGDYVLLSLTDTGCGMSEATKEKMFDPFYSTKGELGTGLGLSQVYGFVQRSHGAIKVHTELNHGTQLMMYFPRYHKYDIDSGSVSNNQVPDLRGNEVIMVVDDEPSLRSLTSDILEEYGYRVVCAENGKQALEIIENESIDLLLSDVIMPEMDGYQLAHTVQKKYPAIKIQLASGFSDDQHANLVGDDLHENLLYKPYDSKTLLLRIRELLDGY